MNTQQLTMQHTRGSRHGEQEDWTVTSDFVHHSRAIMDCARTMQLNIRQQNLRRGWSWLKGRACLLLSIALIILVSGCGEDTIRTAQAAIMRDSTQYPKWKDRVIQRSEDDLKYYWLNLEKMKGIYASPEEALTKEATLLRENITGLANIAGKSAESAKQEGISAAITLIQYGSELIKDNELSGLSDDAIASIRAELNALEQSYNTLRLKPTTTSPESVGTTGPNPGSTIPAEIQALQPAASTATSMMSDSGGESTTTTTMAVDGDGETAERMIPTTLRELSRALPNLTQSQLDELLNALEVYATENPSVFGSSASRDEFLAHLIENYNISVSGVPGATAGDEPSISDYNGLTVQFMNQSTTIRCNVGGGSAWCG